jgi:hypothetical protein
MTSSDTPTVEQLERAVDEWIDEERAAGSRSSLAGALVVLDKLVAKVPITAEDVFTGGGQLIHGRGKALQKFLERSGVPNPEGYLGDGVTTRSTEKFRRLIERLDFGRPLADLGADARAVEVHRLVNRVTSKIAEQLARKPLRIVCDRRESPLIWVEKILAAARDRSAGRVEQHLVGAKLEKRLPNAGIRRDAANAADLQTQRPGDFHTEHSAYHVTASPSKQVVIRARDNIQQGIHPIILVPRAEVERARGLAMGESIENQVSIFAIEEFLAHNIVEMADDSTSDKQFFDVIRNIVEVYNDRIDEAEIDPSLRIELQ